MVLYISSKKLITESIILYRVSGEKRSRPIAPRAPIKPAPFLKLSVNLSNLLPIPSRPSAIWNRRELFSAATLAASRRFSSLSAPFLISSICLLRSSFSSSDSDGSSSLDNVSLNSLLSSFELDVELMRELSFSNFLPTASVSFDLLSSFVSAAIVSIILGRPVRLDNLSSSLSFFDSRPLSSSMSFWSCLVSSPFLPDDSSSERAAPSFWRSSLFSSKALVSSFS